MVLEVLPHEHHDRRSGSSAGRSPSPARAQRCAQSCRPIPEHRKLLPIETFSITAGIKGGIAGGIAMVVPATLFSLSDITASGMR